VKKFMQYAIIFAIGAMIVCLGVQLTSLVIKAM
jgi:hypothetical protein